MEGVEWTNTRDRSEPTLDAELHKLMETAELLRDNSCLLRSEIFELLSEIVEQRVGLRTNALRKYGPPPTIAPRDPPQIMLERS